MLQYLPKRWFAYTDGEKVLKTNLCRRVAIPREIKENPLTWLDYEVQDGEDPRDIAQRYYGNSEDFWLIMLMNDIHVLERDWPKSDNDIKGEFSEEPFEIHHYENSEGEVIDPFGLAYLHDLEDEDISTVIERFSLKPVTVLDHYRNANDKKRKIKVLKADIAESVKQALAEVFL